MVVLMALRRPSLSFSPSPKYKCINHTRRIISAVRQGDSRKWFSWLDGGRCCTGINKRRGGEGFVKFKRKHQLEMSGKYTTPHSRYQRLRATRRALVHYPLMETINIPGRGGQR